MRPHHRTRPLDRLLGLLTGVLVPLLALALVTVDPTRTGSADASTGAEETVTAMTGERGEAGDWFTSWASSQQDVAEETLSNQSVRMISRLSQGGPQLRIRVENRFGTEPLTVDAATVGLSDGTAELAGAARAVTFPRSGRSVVVPAGGEVWSNPVRLRTAAQDDVAISMFVRGEIRPGQHTSDFRTNYLTPAGAGDHVRDRSGAAYTETVTSTYLVSAVDVQNPDVAGTIVSYGSSVVDGEGSQVCGPDCVELGANRRWSDLLAQRILQEAPADSQLTIANAGIGGTTASAECPTTPPELAGLTAEARLDRDVLGLSGVTGVIYYYGTNDLANGCTEEQMIRAHEQVFERLRAAGIDVWAVTTTPRPGYTDEMNLYRHAVNRFFVTGNDCSGHCDGTIDFDRAILDPLDPNSILTAYDTGDGVHANAAGQAAESEVVSITMLLASATD